MVPKLWKLWSKAFAPLWFSPLGAAPDHTYGTRGSNWFEFEMGPVKFGAVAFCSGAHNIVYFYECPTQNTSMLFIYRQGIPCFWIKPFLKNGLLIDLIIFHSSPMKWSFFMAALSCRGPERSISRAGSQAATTPGALYRFVRRLDSSFPWLTLSYAIIIREHSTRQKIPLPVSSFWVSH